MGCHKPQAPPLPLFMDVIFERTLRFKLNLNLLFSTLCLITHTVVWSHDRQVIVSDREELYHSLSHPNSSGGDQISFWTVLSVEIKPRTRLQALLFSHTKSRANISTRFKLSSRVFSNCFRRKAYRVRLSQILPLFTKKKTKLTL
uniref:(northern house mosquito) hypothetical protein n=1 Tax=Culex pipiens TaxID=7175 RepID=A0A8D8IEU4_CULPI